MKPIEIYDLHKSKLDYIRRQSCNLNLVEARTSVNGLTSIADLTDMVEKAVEAVKCEVAFLKDPFEEATLDNFHKQIYDTGSQMQVFEKDMEPIEFDARTLIDCEKLGECLDNIYRAITLWHFSLIKKMELPHHIVKMDLCVTSIIESLYTVLCKSSGINYKSSEEPVSLSGAMPNTECPLIEFKMLDSQKYYNAEETEQIEKAKAERRRAIEEASMKAKMAELAAPYREVIDKHFPNNGYTNMATDAAIVAVCPALKYIFSTLNKSMQRTAEVDDFEHVVIEALKHIEDYNCWQFVIGDYQITYQQMAWINKFFEWFFTDKQVSVKKDYHVFGMDGDFENLDKLEKNDLIDLVVGS